MISLLAAGWLLQSTAGVEHAFAVSLVIGLLAARLTPNPSRRS